MGFFSNLFKPQWKRQAEAYRWMAEAERAADERRAQWGAFSVTEHPNGSTTFENPKPGDIENYLAYKKAKEAFEREQRQYIVENGCQPGDWFWADDKCYQYWYGDIPHIWMHGHIGFDLETGRPREFKEHPIRWCKGEIPND